MSHTSNQITYCGNVHPVRVFSDLEKTLSEITPKIQTEFGGAFPLGLWLPNSAMEEARSSGGIQRMKSCLEGLEAKPITFNAFPMEVFHGQRVKEKVYTPDWSELSRLEYTKSVAQFGSELGLHDFSISTLSGGFRPNDSEEKLQRYLKHWIEWIEWASEFEGKTQTRVCLALEPEPFNTMEDESDAISIWTHLIDKAKDQGLSEELCQRYLGLCFDTCHFSVRYISLVEAWKKLERAGMPVHKIQVSVAPCWKESLGLEALKHFFAWEEPVYLHQSYAMVSGQRHDFVDLDVAKEFKQKADQWRTHFHVPIHFGHREDSTGSELMEFLKYLKTDALSIPVLEVETYSFNSMGEQWGEQESLEASIAKEMLWLQEQMA